MYRDKKGKFSSKSTKYSSDVKRNEDRSGNKVSLTSVVLDHVYSDSAINSSSGVDHDHHGDVISHLGTEEVLHSTPPCLTGRRIIELDTLAEGLQSCVSCSKPLNIIHTVSSRAFGLATVLDIQCVNCSVMNNVHTGRKHGRVYDMNTKLALAMFHSGVGIRQINSIFTTLNMPQVTYSMLGRRQEEVGKVVETIAQESMDMSLQDEVSLNDEEKNEIEVSVDGGWQKRGSGKAYDSLSGHCAMIGAKTGKVLSYEVRSKKCRKCDNKNKQGKVEDHDCRKNWCGSAKAMEPDMVGDMVTKTAKKGILVTSIVGDDDTTTAARLKASVSHTIKKKSDKNHVTKNLANQLYNLQKTFKILTSRVISYFIKLFNYCISQNKHDPEGIHKGLDAIVNHPFGDHSSCDGTWCKFIANPSSRYTTLPYGKPLKNNELREALKNVFGACKKQSDKLSSLGSTQANESLNKSIASKAPKYLHLSGSANLNYRVAASVAQKNLGHTYLSNVNKRLSVSPGAFTIRLAKLRDLQHRKRKAIAITRAAKQRRIKLKQERNVIESLHELHEGPTYSSNIDICQTHIDISTIPRAIPQPGQVGLETFGKKFVFFDLETTGLERTSHITQIGATCNSKHFSTFVQPKKNISPKAQAVTGISLIGSSMFANGVPVQACNISDAIELFIQYLQEISENERNIILVGHNILSFDCKVLFHALEACNKMEQFQNIVHGFLDTYKLFKSAHPDLESYSQENLVYFFLSEKYAAHSAVADVMALERLFTFSKFDQNLLDCVSVPFVNTYHSFVISKSISANMPSLKPLIDKKVISKCIAQRIAGSGLHFHHLSTVSKRNGIEGIRTLLSEKVDGKVRVTKSDRIIMAIGNYFCE